MQRAGEGDLAPWASPNIQHDYEVALGKFVVTFNELDYLLGEIIQIVLARIDRRDLVEECAIKADFRVRRRVLDLLKHSTEGDGLVSVPISSIKALGQERNILVHGHFDQNPFDGTYNIIAKRRAPFYSPERIGELTRQAKMAVDALRYAEAFYGFANCDEEGT
jgi:hypothetical protein